MRTSALAAALSLGAISLLACSSDAKKTSSSSPPPTETLDAAVAAEAPGAIGATCESDVPFNRGTCDEGQACLPTPGGYCTQPCSFDSCPDGSVCASGPRAGDVCLASCESDSDCRKPYMCDRGWKACTLPGIVGPVPPRCEQINAPPRVAWSEPRQISSKAGPGKYHFEPAASIAKDGSLAALYITNGVRTTATKSPFPNVLATSVVLADGTVDGDKTFPSPSENHFDPWVGRDRDGTIHAVWLGFDGGRAPEKNMRVGYARTTDGVTWSEPTAAHRVEDCPVGTDGCLDKPMIAVGPRHDATRKDAIYVLYFSAPRENMMVTRSIDGGKTFEPSAVVAPAAYGDAEVDSKGVLHVVYAESSPQQFSSADGRVKYRFSSDGGKTFSDALEVSAPTESIPFFFSNPQVVADPARKRLSVVYPAGDATGKWDIMLATSTDRGKTWKRTRVNDDESCANHMTPTATIQPKTGTIHVAWNENRGGAGRVVASLCDPKKLSCGANEQVSAADFAAYSFARHSPKWLGEYFTLVADPQRKRLHAVWTQPVDEDGRPISRIFWSWRPL